jgi:hypothetical protein
MSYHHGTGETKVAEEERQWYHLKNVDRKNLKI